MIKIPLKILFYLFLFILIILIFIKFDYTKKIISRAIYAHDFSLLTHKIFSKINNEIDFDMEKIENKEKSLLILNRYVFDFMQFEPSIGNIDDGTQWKILHGSILCDGIVDIFLRLAENTNTRVTQANLYNDSGKSPHTIALVNLKNDITNFDNQEKIKKMFIFDPLNYYTPLDKNNSYQDINYFLNNKNEFLNYNYLNSDNKNLNLLHNDINIFMENRLLTEYHFINKISKIIAINVSEKLLKFILEFGIMINPDLKDEYKELMYARLEHVLLNYDEALKKYKIIIMPPPKDMINFTRMVNFNYQHKYYHYAQYWIKSVQNSKSKLKSLNEIIN